MSVYAVPRRPVDTRRPSASRLIGGLTPDTSQTVTGVVLTITPSLPIGDVIAEAPLIGIRPERAIARIPRIVPKSRTYLPNVIVTLDQEVTGLVLSITPTLPLGDVVAEAPLIGIRPAKGIVQVPRFVPKSRLYSGTIFTPEQAVTGLVLTVTPTLPAGDIIAEGPTIGIRPLKGIIQRLTERTVRSRVLEGFTPTEAAGDQSVTGVVLEITPSLPVGVVSLEATPSLRPTRGPVPVPQGRILRSRIAQGFTPGTASQTVTGVALTVTPELPAGSISTEGDVFLGPTAAVEPLRVAGPGRLKSRLYSITNASQDVTGVVLTIIPTLPAGTVVNAQVVTGVVLVITPTLPIGDVVPAPTDFCVEVQEIVSHFVATSRDTFHLAEIERSVSHLTSTEEGISHDIALERFASHVVSTTEEEC